MKIWLEDTEIKQVYKLDWSGSFPIASFLMYSEIMPLVFKTNKWTIKADPNGVWRASLPFDKITDDIGTTVWQQ